MREDRAKARRYKYDEYFHGYHRGAACGEYAGQLILKYLVNRIDVVLELYKHKPRAPRMVRS